MTPASPEIYTLSLHDALPIFLGLDPALREDVSHGSGERFKAFTGTRHFRIDDSVKKQMAFVKRVLRSDKWSRADRKSTRLNSSHEWISYAVFCLKKKKM